MSFDLREMGHDQSTRWKNSRNKLPIEAGEGLEHRKQRSRTSVEIAYFISGLLKPSLAGYGGSSSCRDE